MEAHFFTLFTVFLLLINFTRSDRQSWRQDMLDWHNHYRRLHDAPDLILDDEVMRFSEYYASFLAERELFEHSHGKYGENLYMGTRNDSKTAIGLFYSEIAFYDWPDPEASIGSLHKWGHFSQVIWKSSRKLGVGIAYNHPNFYVVCNYAPAGNLIGSFVSNVRPSKDKPMRKEEIVVAGVTLLVIAAIVGMAFTILRASDGSNV